MPRFSPRSGGWTLEELGALDLQTWRSLRPSGAVDLVVRERADEQVGEESQPAGARGEGDEPPDGPATSTP